jgi:hypothetical protein
MAMFKFLLLLLSLFSPLSLAEALPPPESSQAILVKVAAVVESHAKTLGCSVSVNPKTILPYRLNNEPMYLAVYSADIGCSGGNTMHRPVFVAVTPGAYGKYFIDPRYSSPQQTSNEFPQLISELFIQAGELWYKALELDPAKDSLCCPSSVVTGRVQFEKGAWRPAPSAKSHP